MRRQALTLLLTAALALLLAWPAAAGAAEVLQVRSGRLLQVGDRNRTYTVELACLTVPAEREEEAISWLRQALPRRSRVNLRPMGQQDGLLLARISRLDDGADLADGLIAAGLASAEPCP